MHRILHIAWSLLLWQRSLAQAQEQPQPPSSPTFHQPGTFGVDPNFYHLWQKHQQQHQQLINNNNALLMNNAFLHNHNGIAPLHDFPPLHHFNQQHFFQPLPPMHNQGLTVSGSMLPNPVTFTEAFQVGVAAPALPQPAPAANPPSPIQQLRQVPTMVQPSSIIQTTQTPAVALAVTTTVGTLPPDATTAAPESIRQRNKDRGSGETMDEQNLIKKLLDETLRSVHLPTREELIARRSTPVSTTTSTSTTTTTTTASTTTTTTTTPPSTSPPSSREESANELFRRLNLSESARRAIVARVEQLLRLEIAKKVIEQEKSAAITQAPLHLLSSATTLGTVPTKTTIFTTTFPSTISTTPRTTQRASSTATTTLPPTTTVDEREQQLERVREELERQRKEIEQRERELEEKQKEDDRIRKEEELLLEIERRAAEQLRYQTELERVRQQERAQAAKVGKLVVQSAQKDIRESQPRLTSFGKEDYEEDGDLTSPPISNGREEIVPLRNDEVSPLQQGSDHHYRSVTFSPVTGQPLNLEEESGLIDQDFNQRTTPKASGFVPTQAALPTFATNGVLPSVDPNPDKYQSSKNVDNAAPEKSFDLVTTPPFRPRRPLTTKKPHERTQFEVLASDYQTRLAQSEDITHFLKNFYENAYIALIERNPPPPRYTRYAGK